MSDLNVKIVRYPALMKGKLLIQPEVEEGLDTINTRLMRRGKGAGERNNAINVTRSKLLRRYNIETSHRPRSTGWAKKAYSRRIFASMAPNVVRKILQRIQIRWAS